MCMCVCKRILMRCAEGHYRCFWRKANGWLTSLDGSKHVQALPKAEPCIMLCIGNLDRGRTLREAFCVACLGALPQLLPTPRVTSLVLPKASFSFRMQSSTRARCSGERRPLLQSPSLPPT